MKKSKKIVAVLFLSIVVSLGVASLEVAFAESAVAGPKPCC